MSETGNSDKTVTAAPPKATLHLKRPVEQGTVRQSFSHGRSKAVVVEKVKRRILTPAEAAAAARCRARARPPPRRRRLRPSRAYRRGAARSRRAREADRSATAQDRRRPAHLERRAARSARPGADRRACVRRRRIAAARRRRPGLGASARRAIASNARPPKRASATKSFAARRKPISSGSRRTRRDDAFPAANRRRLRQSRALRPAAPSVAVAGSARPNPCCPWRRRGRAAGRRQASGARAAAGAEGRRPDAAADAHRRAAQSWPADGHQRDFG